MTYRYQPITKTETFAFEAEYAVIGTGSRTPYGVFDSLNFADMFAEIVTKSGWAVEVVKVVK